ncbi:MAG: pyruvate formate-lyase-activating protein [Lachnospiraceae bacterium]|nr:pyruvate formate-lyase-activating protein [Lachnospiraceae bacterium]
MDTNNKIGRVHSIETFGLVDGPGVRCVVFLQGCKLRCKYCHNPETWTMQGGKDWEVNDLFDFVYKFHNYWKNNGGVTFSGGEPLLQVDFLIEFFKLAKEKGVNTAIDTAGQPFSLEEPFISKFNELMELTDLFILDFKTFYSDRHKELTGQNNENILQMARYLSDHGKKMWIRHVLVPGLTDDEQELKEMKSFIDSLSGVDRVEILPYHTLGLFKWEKIGVKYPLEDARTPNMDEVEKAEHILGIR